MPAIAPSPSSSSASASPAASALAAPSASPTGTDAASQPGDFDAQFHAAIEPDGSSAPSASTPAAPAPAPAPAPAAGKGKDAPDAAADTDTDGGDPTSAPAPDPTAALEGMAALLASLTPPPPPSPAPTPAPVAGASSATPSADADGGGDAATALPATTPTATSSLFASASTPSVGAPLPGMPTALGSASSVAAPMALAAAAALTSPAPQGTENNATPSSVDGNNVPSAVDGTIPAAPLATDKNGQNHQKGQSDDSDTQKSPQNDPLSAAFPAAGTVSGQLGTLYSNSAGMPAVMDKTAAPQAPIANDPAALGTALAAIAPTKVGATFSAASFLRGYPIAPANGRDAHTDPASSSAPASLQAAQALSVSGQAPSGAAADKTVALTSNDQFVDVIRQALDDRPMLAPQRIAVELQTPPGATVTVFFSQSNGQLRAQLSASDSSSMHWLQQQVGNLRDGGGNAASVVWLPPQLDRQQGGDPSPQQQQRQQQEQPRQAAPPSADDMALAESLFGGIAAGTDVRN